MPQRKMTSKLLFLIGVFAFGLSYETLKATFDNPVFIFLSLLCIVLLRLVAKRFGK